ncbi:YidH family protein [Microbacterium sp. G2-8]|uniref:YidH family protein n=1 Tax=Microbacterium sp. G2-8 TaxID=2842454 RepID=UPI001C8AD2FE|nr:DUF202 domain-containing protein [Microbacterium sp. G2-8]
MTPDESKDPAPRSPSRGPLTRRVFRGGTEPDPRFSLANERTFLAWIRTALAFIAGGVALGAFGIGTWPEVAHKSIAIAVITVGVLISVGACTRWWRVESSMRHGRPLPVPGIVPLLALVSAAGAAGAIVMVLTA